MCDVCSKLLPTCFDMPFCQLVCWFANPVEPDAPLSELFGHSGTGTIFDELFFGCRLITNFVFADCTDICLRHSLANLVACAIGTQESARSSHLWYLVFAPEKLKGTYFAGCMVYALECCMVE